MTGEDHVVAVDEDGIGEAELTDAISDLPGLLLRASPRVARAGCQRGGARCLMSRIDRGTRSYLGYPLDPICPKAQSIVQRLEDKKDTESVAGLGTRLRTLPALFPDRRSGFPDYPN